MPVFYAENYVFPLIGYYRESEKGKIKNIYGTASYMMNNIFITAAHSIQSAVENELFGIAFQKDPLNLGQYIYHRAIEYELFPDLDLGLIKVILDIPVALPYRWDISEGMIFEDVQSIGFPFAFDAINNVIYTRGLKGYIVSRSRLYRLKKAPFIYEISFHCPKGISGAPLTTTIGTPKLKGFVIGNEATEILVFREKEIEEISNQKVVHEKYETTKFGIAIQCKNLLNIESKLLGTSFENYLKQNELI